MVFIDNAMLNKPVAEGHITISYGDEKVIPFAPEYFGPYGFYLVSKKRSFTETLHDVAGDFDLILRIDGQRHAIKNISEAMKSGPTFGSNGYYYHEIFAFDYGVTDFFSDYELTVVPRTNGTNDVISMDYEISSAFVL
ncbi:hypothetical protein JCM12178A_03260 [Salidesulfovibrio brasiliensis]